MNFVTKSAFIAIFAPLIFGLTGCLHSSKTSQSNTERAVSIVQEMLHDNQPLKAELMKGGASQASVIKVTAPDNAYVVRFLDRQFSGYHEQEIICQNIASQAGYGPKFYYGDTKEGVIVMEYLQPEPFPAEKNKLSSIVQLVRKIHSGPEFPLTISTYDLIDASIKTLASYDQKVIDLNQLHNILAVIKKTLTPFIDRVPCHRDLNPGNLVYTRGQFFAIDYMSASQDDPYSDLAMIAIFNCFTPDAEKSLLTLYLERQPGEQDCAHLSLMKAVVYLNIATMLLSGPNHAITQNNPAGQSNRNYLQMLQAIGQGKVDLTNPQHKLEFALSMIQEVVIYHNSQQWHKDVALLQMT